MVQAAEKNDRILQIHHCLRYAPFFRMVHETVVSGRLGQIMEYAHLISSFSFGRYCARGATSAGREYHSTHRSDRYNFRRAPPDLILRMVLWAS